MEGRAPTTRSTARRCSRQMRRHDQRRFVAHRLLVEPTSTEHRLLASRQRPTNPDHRVEAQLREDRGHLLHSLHRRLHTTTPSVRGHVDVIEQAGLHRDRLPRRSHPAARGVVREAREGMHDRPERFVGDPLARPRLPQLPTLLRADSSAHRGEVLPARGPRGQRRVRALRRRQRRRATAHTGTLSPVGTPRIRRLECHPSTAPTGVLEEPPSDPVRVNGWCSGGVGSGDCSARLRGSGGYRSTDVRELGSYRLPNFQRRVVANSRYRAYDEITPGTSIPAGTTKGRRSTGASKERTRNL